MPSAGKPCNPNGKAGTSSCYFSAAVCSPGRSVVSAAACALRISPRKPSAIRSGTMHKGSRLHKNGRPTTTENASPLRPRTTVPASHSGSTSKAIASILRPGTLQTIQTITAPVAGCRCCGDGATAHRIARDRAAVIAPVPVRVQHTSAARNRVPAHRHRLAENQPAGSVPQVPVARAENNGRDRY